MKTIEERAKEFALRVKDIDCGDCESCSKCNDYMTYVGIATEQRKIDIDKACEWLKSQADECFVSGDSVGEHLVFKDLNLAEFLKAMGE